MTLPPTFSRRKRAAAGTAVDVYTYDVIPEGVRIQIVHILRAAFDTTSNNDHREAEIYAHLAQFVREEKGVHRLNHNSRDRDQFLSWVEEETEIDLLLDGLERALILIDGYVRENDYWFSGKKDADQAIGELNGRLAEAGIGYRFEGREILRVDSEFVHAEIVVPALGVLRQSKFAAAEQEYRAAHEAYRHADYETCLVQSAKAFESVLKVIGGGRGWAIKETDPAKRLLDAAYEASFIPPALQAEFTALRSLLESGVPTLRNKLGGHGAGASPRELPQHFAALQLHQTAAAILFLASQDEAVG